MVRTPDRLHDRGMDAFTRKLALRNAAKVAFGSMFFGCGGAIMSDAGTPDAKADAPPIHDAAVVDAATAPDAALACTGPTAVDAGDVSEETFQCCVATVQSDVGDASPWGDPNGPDASLVTNSPAATNCCNAILARIDDEPDGGDLSADYGAAGQLIQWCCMAVGDPMGPACTPWGPPSPPEMEVA